MPVWEARVSPVFDVAKTILIADVDAESGEVLMAENHAIDPARPVATLSSLGVELLVCSAISPPVEAALWVAGIEVVPDICGAPAEIIAALFSSDDELERFRSPGSRRQPKSSRAPGAPRPESRIGASADRAQRRARQGGRR